MKYISYLFIVGILAASIGCGNAKKDTTFQYQEGDIIFQEGDTSAFSKAIQKVTPPFEDKSFTHVGIVCKENDSLYVLEAVFKGVAKTSLQSFLQKSITIDGKPCCYVGRLKPQYSYTIPAAIAKASTLLGRPYDFGFDLKNDDYYCSELVQLAFTDSLSNPLFGISPMTFKDPATMQTFSNWQAFFDEKGLAVPEGEPGISPNSIALSDKVEIVWRYY